MAHKGIYMYPYTNEVTMGNFSMPFNQQKLTIYKGVNNQLTFTVHNADGKYLVLKDNELLCIRIYDNKRNVIVYESVLDKKKPDWISESGTARPTLGNKVKVYYGCVIPAGFIQDFSVGYKYRWSIIKVTLNGDLYEPQEYLYTGTNFEACGELTISDQGAPMFTPSAEISEETNGSWNDVKHTHNQVITEDMVGKFEVMVSTPLRASAQQGMVDGLGTIAFYFKDFIGRVQLQACLSNDFPTQSEDYKWFIVPLDCEEYITNMRDENNDPIPMNCIQAFNVKGNFMWLRVVVCIPPEEIERSETVGKRNLYNPFTTLPKILYRK